MHIKTTQPGVFRQQLLRDVLDHTRRINRNLCRDVKLRRIRRNRNRVTLKRRIQSQVRSIDGIAGIVKRRQNVKVRVVLICIARFIRIPGKPLSTQGLEDKSSLTVGPVGNLADLNIHILRITTLNARGIHLNRTDERSHRRRAARAKLLLQYIVWNNRGLTRCNVRQTAIRTHIFIRLVITSRTHLRRTVRPSHYVALRIRDLNHHWVAVGIQNRHRTNRLPMATFVFNERLRRRKRLSANRRQLIHRKIVKR